MRVPLERTWYYVPLYLRVCIFFFLIAPIVVVIPLSFNAVPFFTFTPEMLALDPAGYSLKWYIEFFNSLNWQGAVKNSVIIAFFATILGNRSWAPWRRLASAGPRCRSAPRSWRS